MKDADCEGICLILGGFNLDTTLKLNLSAKFPQFGEISIQGSAKKNQFRRDPVKKCESTRRRVRVWVVGS